MGFPERLTVPGNLLAADQEMDIVGDFERKMVQDATTPREMDDATQTRFRDECRRALNGALEPDRKLASQAQTAGALPGVSSSGANEEDTRKMLLKFAPKDDSDGRDDAGCGSAFTRESAKKPKVDTSPLILVK